VRNLGSRIQSKRLLEEEGEISDEDRLKHRGIITVQKEDGKNTRHTLGR
jgi:hypothetical protein